MYFMVVAVVVLGVELLSMVCKGTSGAFLYTFRSCGKRERYLTRQCQELPLNSVLSSYMGVSADIEESSRSAGRRWYLE